MARSRANAEQKRELALLTRRANRRLERASEGQRKYLEVFVQRMTGATKFSSSHVGLTPTQIESKLQKLRQFLSHELTSTRAGWKSRIAENVSKARQTWNKWGFDLTDEELAEILIQVDTANKGEYYRVVNLVYAKKREQYDGLDAIPQDKYKQLVSEAIMDKASAQDAAVEAIKIWNTKKK